MTISNFVTSSEITAETPQPLCQRAFGDAATIEKIVSRGPDSAWNETKFVLAKSFFRLFGICKVNTAVSNFAPSMADKMSAKYVDRQHYEERPINPDGSLHQPSEKTAVVGQTAGTGGREAD